MSDNPRKDFLSYVSELRTRSLIVEFKGGFTTVSGAFNITGITESNVQLRLAASTCATCELEISLPALRSFWVTTFAEAMNSVLKPAVEALMAEGHSFHADVVEQVGVVGLADGSTCLIGVLKEEIDGQPASSAIVN